jgi:prepilin-type N-terminal cleavage/methylation domain-containing protein
VIRRIHRQSGFTLIELLVVLSVIVIVAAILFPVFAANSSLSEEPSIN